MQYCSLCNTQYNDITKVCPLEHCNNCGSLKLKKQFTRSFKNLRDKTNFSVGVGFTAFFVFLYGYTLAGSQGRWDVFMGIIIGYIVLAFLIFLNRTKQNVSCLDCKAHNFTAATTQKLRKIRKKNEDSSEQSVGEQLDSNEKITSDVFDNFSKEQKRHNRRDLILKITGLVATATILIFANFIFNPQVEIETTFGTIPLIQNPLLSWILPDGERGSFYIDKNAGFMIEKVDENWTFIKDIDKLRPNLLPLKSNSDYLGGILVARHSGETVLVTVYDQNFLVDSLSDYVDGEIEFSSSVSDIDFVLRKKFVSPDEDYAFFEVEVNDPNNPLSEYQTSIYRILNGKFYSLTFSSEKSQNISEERVNEIKKILSSFTILY